MIHNKNKKAFTMVELVFVIVILGIVASISSSIIAQLFENYIVQRAMHRVSLKTELAANQIANRLSYALASSVIVYDANSTTNYELLKGIDPSFSDADPQTLEWIGIDNDSFSTGQRMAGWSGYCDTSLASTTGTTVRTPGSQLTLANTVISNLSGSAKGLADAALVFDTEGRFSDTLTKQDGTCYGYVDGAATCIHQVSGYEAANDINLTLDNTLPDDAYISQHYKLAWSAYALVPVNVTSNSLFDLALRYNYQPWDGSQFSDDGISSSIILRNVTSFKFSQQSNTIRFKICATEKIGDANTTNISVCKEKVVIR